MSAGALSFLALAIAVCGHFFSHWFAARLAGADAKLAFPCCCAPKDGAAFNALGAGRRALVLLAGPLVGYLIGVVPLTLLFMAPAKVPSLTIESTHADLPAAKAGLQSGDVIVGIDGDRAHSFAQLRE